MLRLDTSGGSSHSCEACAPTQGTGNPRRPSMKWHTPKIVEIACGGEINAYFPAEL
jgi:coenzyme PQQ precursor peptide PqqA